MVSYMEAELGGCFHWKVAWEVPEWLVLRCFCGGMPWGIPAGILLCLH